MARTKRAVSIVVIAALGILFAYLLLGQFGDWQWQIAREEMAKQVKAFIDGMRDGRVPVDSTEFEKVVGPIDRKQLLKDVGRDYELNYGYRTGCMVDVSVVFHGGGELVLLVGENRRSLLSLLFCFWGRYSVSVIKYLPRGDDEKSDSGL